MKWHEKPEIKELVALHGEQILPIGHTKKGSRVEEFSQGCPFCGKEESRDGETVICSACTARVALQSDPEKLVKQAHKYGLLRIEESLCHLFGIELISQPNFQQEGKHAKKFKSKRSETRGRDQRNSVRGDSWVQQERPKGFTSKGWAAFLSTEQDQETVPNA